jgi:chitodextrinase
VATTAGTTGIATGLSCGTNYTLGIDAVDAAGNRSAQAVVMVATAACADTQAPTAPTGLTVSGVTQTAMTVAWSASSDNVGVVGYTVDRNGTVVAQPTSPTATLSGLTCGTTYTIGVRARDAAGNASARSIVTATAALCSATSSAAQVAVSLAGNDSTCVRGDLSKPCASFDRAYQIAQLGDTVQVAGGAYPGQTVVSSSGKDTTGDSPDVVFQPAAGATVTVADLSLGTQVLGTNGPDHITIRGISDNSFTSGSCQWEVLGDVYDVTFDNVKLCNFYINLELGSGQVASGLTIRNSEFMGCVAGGSVGCGNIKLDGADNFLFENNFVHDFQIVPGSGEHFECMFISDMIGGIFRNNKFKNCVFYNIFHQRCGVQNGGRCVISGLTYENNWFDAPNDGQQIGGGGVRPTGIAFSPRGTGFPNILIRFNSFDDSTGVSVNDDGDGSTNSNFRIVGNIIGGSPQCGYGASYNYNVFLGSGTCGTGATTAKSSSVYVNPAELRSGGDYHLMSSPARDVIRGSDADATLASDIDGQSRPMGLGRDAGSDESG